MPYLSEGKKVVGTTHDRRVKLTPEQKEEIRQLFADASERAKQGILQEAISQRKVAKMYGVSRRTIVWVLYPERLEKNKKDRQERGGWKQYYKKEEHREAMKKTRRHKQELHLRGAI